jgi:hypothetical protein
MRYLITCVLAALVISLPTISSICVAQKVTNKPTVLKPASSGATTTDAKIDIAQHYTKQMATQANLDLQNPKLSTDGFLSQSDPQSLASSECLLAQTVLRAQTSSPGLTADEIESLCKSLSANSKTKPINYQTAFGATVKGPTIDYALLHIVRWDAPKTSAGPPAPTGNWYLFDRGNNRESGSIIPWKNVSGVSPITATNHLLGSRNVAFLAIQLGVDDTCGIKYDLTSTHTTPLNQQDVSNLIQIAISILGKNSKTTAPAKSLSTNKTPAPEPVAISALEPGTISAPSTNWVGVWGGEVMVKQDRLPASLAMTPSMTGTVRAFSKGEVKTPGLDDSVVATCSAAPKTSPVGTTARTLGNDPSLSGETASRQRTAHLELTAYPTSDLIDDNGLAQGSVSTQEAKTAPTRPAKSATGYATDKNPLAALAQTVTNEPAHHWDVSIAMPVMSYKSLKYDSTNDLLVPKTTTSVNPYALFDVYPVAVDLAKYAGTGLAISFPKFTVGIPIGNQPLQKPFVGGGFIGTVKSFHFQPIVGLHIQKEVRADSATSALTHTEWHAKLQVMIGFSITDAKKVLGIK